MKRGEEGKARMRSKTVTRGVTFCGENVAIIAVGGRRRERRAEGLTRHPPPPYLLLLTPWSLG